jgi:hypothetical protein
MTIDAEPPNTKGLGVIVVMRVNFRAAGAVKARIFAAALTSLRPHQFAGGNCVVSFAVCQFDRAKVLDDIPARGRLSGGTHSRTGKIEILPAGQAATLDLPRRHLKNFFAPGTKRHLHFPKIPIPASPFVRTVACCSGVSFEQS